jgi:hypothetical protein
MHSAEDLLVQLRQLPVDILQSEIFPHVEEPIKKVLSKYHWYDNLISSVTFQAVEDVAFSFSDIGLAFSFIVYQSGYNEKIGDYFEATQYKYAHDKGTFFMQYSVFICKDKEGKMDKVCTNGRHKNTFTVEYLDNKHKNCRFDIYTLSMVLRDKQYFSHEWDCSHDRLKDILKYEYERHLQKLLHIPDAYYIYSANIIIDRSSCLWIHDKGLSEFSRCKLPLINRELYKNKIEEKQSMIRDWINNIIVW